MISALSPWQWVLLGLIPPAVLLLYFLKLRRQPLEVPSTFLWRKTIEDLHVNSLWQRLRQNILLYLQLLFLAALILACLRPGFSGASTEGKRLIFLVDNSASMQATDVKTTRLTEAKKMVRTEIENMQRGDVAMLLAFSDRADVRQGFTGDRRRLLSALDSIQPTNHVTDLSEALRAAAGLANPGRASFDNVNDIQVADAQPATMYIYSDGGFPPINEFDMGNLTAKYIPIGATICDNVSILAFSVERNEEKSNEVEAFARIQNHGPEKVTVTASLYLDDSLLDATNVDINPGEESGVNFQLNYVEESILRLVIDRPDELSIDNQAYAALRPPRQMNLLLLTPGNQALEKALETAAVQRIAQVQVEMPEYAETPEYRTKLDASDFDLIIFDQCEPKKKEDIPAANTLYIGSKPPDDAWKMGEAQGPVFILDLDRSHPMMQYLEMGSVRIVEGRTVAPPDGGSLLMTADIGPVMAIAPRGPYQDAVLGFSIVRIKETGPEVNTDWTIKRSFPVFVYSIVEYLGGGVTNAAAQSVIPGQSIAMSLSNRYDEFRIQPPQGPSISMKRGPQSQFVFTQTHTPGTYQIFAEGIQQPLEVFAVNMFSQRECQIATVNALQLGAENVSASKSTIIGRKEYWRWLLMLGLLILAIEWVIYNRRVFV